MYAGVLGEKPKKSYLGLYQRSKQHSPRHSSAPAGQNDDVHSESSYPNSTTEGDDGYSWSRPLQPDAALRSTRSVPALYDASHAPSAYSAPLTAREDTQGSYAGSRHSGASSSKLLPNKSYPYGAAPNELVLLQQYGLDGRSVFPDGYLNYLNKISFEPEVSARRAPRTKEERPQDHFASQRHRLISEKADNFDNANANWINALRGQSDVPVVTVRQNGGSCRSAVKSQQVRRSPPYASKKASKRPQQEKVRKAKARAAMALSNKGENKRWVPTESRSLNGWIAGLRADTPKSSRTTSSRRRPLQRRAESLQGRSDRSWLRSCQENRHLLKHSTHSGQINQQNQRIFEAENARDPDDPAIAPVLVSFISSSVAVRKRSTSHPP